MTQSIDPDISTKPFLLEKKHGSLSFGTYEILGIIGEGGMGTVYKGYHVRLKRFVAIKTMRLNYDKRPDLVSRFLREMEFVGQMDHPNVVRATDAGESNGVLYLVMEYLTGTDVGRLVGAAQRLSMADASELVRQAALGLDYVHRLLVHRDVKPSNLMLTTSGLVKILDLGLARGEFREAARTELTPHGFALGTYAYMAPEQASLSSAVDGRADIYSLGCTLFKLLTGHIPFGDPPYGNSIQQLYAHCHVPLSEARAFDSVPHDLRPLLLAMTAKDPGERLKTGQEVADALAPFAVGSDPVRLLDSIGQTEPPLRPVQEPVLQQHTTSVEPSGSTPWVSSTLVMPVPMRRRFWVSVALAACAVAIAVPTLVYFWPQTVPAVQAPAAQPEANQPEVIQPRAIPKGPWLLDELAPHKTFALLEREPLPVSYDENDPLQWHWDAAVRLLDVHSPNFLFFPLGTTARSHFVFETTIFQTPWSGNVGVFWGFQCDRALMNAKKPGQRFATFHLLKIEEERGAESSTFVVKRGKGSLLYGKRGELALDDDYFKLQMVPGATGSIVLQFEVFNKRLRSARFGSVELRELYTDEENQRYPESTYEGAVGIFSMKRAAMFSNVNFIARSRQ